MSGNEYSFRQIIGVTDPTRVQLEGVVIGEVIEGILPQEIRFSLYPTCDDPYFLDFEEDKPVRVSLRNPNDRQAGHKIMSAREHHIVIRISGQYSPDTNSGRDPLGNIEAESLWFTNSVFLFPFDKQR